MIGALLRRWAMVAHGWFLFVAAQAFLLQMRAEAFFGSQESAAVLQCARALLALTAKSPVYARGHMMAALMFEGHDRGDH